MDEWNLCKEVKYSNSFDKQLECKKFDSFKDANDYYEKNHQNDTCLFVHVMPANKKP